MQANDYHSTGQASTTGDGQWIDSSTTIARWLLSTSTESTPNKHLCTLKVKSNSTWYLPSVRCGVDIPRQWRLTLCLCVWQVSLDSHHLLSSHFKVRLISFLVFDFTPNASTYGRGYVPLQWMEWNNLNSSGDFSRLSNVIASTLLPLLITCRKRKLCLCSNCLASLPTWHAEITLVHFCLLKR